MANKQKFDSKSSTRIYNYPSEWDLATAGITRYEY